MVLRPLLLMLLMLLAALLIDVARARPNFIVMQPDDLQFDSAWTPPAHFPGKSAAEYNLPHLETLRTNGLQMMRAHAASPLCGTSRYSTMTGRYPSRSALSRQRQSDVAVLQTVTIPMTKLQDSARVQDGNDCSANNLAAILSQNSYATGMMGKWHLYNAGRNETYDYTAIQAAVRSCGFGTAEAVYHENLNDDWTNNGEFSHNMEYVTAKAIDFINSSVDNNQEFFLYFNPTAPHNSGDVYEALTELSCLAAPEGTLAEEPVVPGMTEGVGCDAYRQTVVDRANGVYSNAVLGAIWVDDAVGALVKHLKAIGQLDNTFFLFQQDHGQEGKGSIYEPGSRIAQFIHYPDLISTAGTTFDGLVSTIDIAPTILDYAGIDSSSPGWYNLDGMSWKAAVEQQDGTWNERCIVVEGETDRGVTCGCDKYLSLSDLVTTATATMGTRNNLVATSSLFDLCDSGGKYITSPEISRETIAVSNGATLASLLAVLDCHLGMTLPANNAPQYGLCDSLMFSGATSAPQQSPATAAPVTPTTISGCSCTQDADISEAIYQEEITTANLIITTAGIPNHVYHTGRDRTNPNVVCLQPVTATLPLVPQLSGTFTETNMGVIGILKTGAFLYNHKSNHNGVDDVANHANNEQPSLDTCHGHADQQCTYHYHEISQLAACTHDDQGDACELIGYMLDGFPVYSHCFSAIANRDLTSCYTMTSDTDGGNGDDTSDWTHIESTACDLDQANGFDFTGMNIQDNTGSNISGYAYVATHEYPYVMPFYAGSTWNRVVSVDWPLTTATTPAPNNPSVTVAPASTPTISPTAAPTDSSKTCFSGSNTAEVLGKGTITIDSLNIVDYVQASEDGSNLAEFPDDCGTLLSASAGDDETSWWFRVEGNGDYLRLLPSSSSCSDTWENVTMAVVVAGGASCEDLTCVLEPQVFDLSCTSISKRQRRLGQQQLRSLQPITLGQSDFLTVEGITYYIIVGGIADIALPSLESLPFEIASLGPGPANSTAPQEEDESTGADDLVDATDAPTVSSGEVDPNNPGRSSEETSSAPSEAPTQPKKSSSAPAKKHQLTVFWALMACSGLAAVVLL
jgi:arylsulfatase A-like enzyme